MNGCKDCYYSLENGVLTIGNSLTERRIRIDERGVTPLSLADKRSGKVWTRDGEEMTIPNPFGRAAWQADAFEADHGGLSERHLAVRIVWKRETGESVERVFEAYPGIAAIHMRMSAAGSGVWRAQKAGRADYDGTELTYDEAKPGNDAPADAIDLMLLPDGHYDLRAIELIDKSDRNDTLVRETVRPVYNHGWGQDEAEGNLFIFEDRMDGNAVMLVKEAPTRTSMLGRGGCDLDIQKNKYVRLLGNGLDGQEMDEDGVYAYGSTMMTGKKEEIIDTWRALYRAMWRPGEQVRVLSNTWGDRNQDKAVCHDFMMREIDRAHELGVQVVQIDDGWQLGKTANSALAVSTVWEGYYAANPDFWAVNPQKFPAGLKPLVEYAAGFGIELGLWFSPDSSHDFANWERDAGVLMRFYRELGIRRFKLDGVKIRNKRCERNYLRILERLNEESGGRICVNQDITAEIRLGQVYRREHGNLFVENRYTDFGSYYPHNTLKNLWELSRFVPAGKMQFECLNRARNHDKYPENDPLAPKNYDMDYLFAVTMAASPLIWMEMSHLEEADAARLKGIISAYKLHQDRIARGDVRPVGQKPDGRSFTGFDVSMGDGSGYLILFREWTEEDGGVFDLPGWKGKKMRIELIRSNDEEASVEAGDGFAEFRTGKLRTYAFVRYEAEE